MGIRFSCSNGHKLNVKAELAGRKGRCPQCGVSVQIPQESETSKTKESEKPSTATLLSDPNAVWYIQVPHGPQYGPATGAVIENWIKERRVSPNMLVWKEGWNHWLEAKNAFPDLLQLFSSSPKIELPPASINESVPSEIAAVFLSPPLRGKMNKKKKLSRNTIILTVLIGMIVLLGILLAGVLNR